MSSGVVDQSPLVQVPSQHETAQDLMFEHPTQHHLHLPVVPILGLKQDLDVVPFVDADEITDIPLEELLEVELDFVQDLRHFGLAHCVQGLLCLGGDEVARQLQLICHHLLPPLRLPVPVIYIPS